MGRSLLLVVFDEPGSAAAAGAIIFGMTGMIFGTPIGAIKGETTVYAR